MKKERTHTVARFRLYANVSLFGNVFCERYFEKRGGEFGESFRKEFREVLLGKPLSPDAAAAILFTL